MVAICGKHISAVHAMHIEIFRIVFICDQCFHTLRFPNHSTLDLFLYTPKMTFPVQREVGSVSHWSCRYLVVGEMRHKKPSQGLPKS